MFELNPDLPGLSCEPGAALQQRLTCSSGTGVVEGGDTRGAGCGGGDGQQIFKFADRAAERSVRRATPSAVPQAGVGAAGKAQMDVMLAHVQEGLAAGLGVDEVLLCAFTVMMHACTPLLSLARLAGVRWQSIELYHTCFARSPCPLLPRCQHQNRPVLQP